MHLELHALYVVDSLSQYWNATVSKYNVYLDE